MDALFQSTLANGKIVTINQCWLYLNIMTLTDITIGDGTRVDPDLNHNRLT